MLYFNNSLPNTVKYIAIGKYTYVYVWYKNIVESTFLLVSEKRIGHPYLLRIRHCEVLYSLCILKEKYMYTPINY